MFGTEIIWKRELQMAIVTTLYIVLTRCSYYKKCFVYYVVGYELCTRIPIQSAEQNDESEPTSKNLDRSDVVELVLLL